MRCVSDKLENNNFILFFDFDRVKYEKCTSHLLNQILPVEGALSGHLPHYEHTKIRTGWSSLNEIIETYFPVASFYE